MKFRDVPQSGSRGNIVASRNRAGAYQRERVSPDQPATAAQCATWDSMADVSLLWNLLEEEQWAAWGRLAEGIHSRPNLGLSGRLSGCQLFKKINRLLATCHRQPLLDPPPMPQFGPNPVQGFEIRKARGRIALILKVSRKPPWQARPPLEDIMVQSWAPYHAGTRKNNLYALLGRLPPPVGEESDITDIYLMKLKEWRKLKHKRYQVPLEGSKLYIRVWQQVNGWVNELGVFQASALVPVNRDLRARELAALLGRWPTAPRHQ
jgi:hypothetical protein